MTSTERQMMKVALFETQAERNLRTKVDMLTGIERAAIDAARYEDPMLRMIREHHSSHRSSFDDLIRSTAERKAQELNRYPATAYSPTPMRSIRLHAPAAPSTPTPQQLASNALVKLSRKCEELKDSLGEGESLSMTFKSGEDCVSVRKVSLDGALLELEGIDANGNETFVAISPDDLHYLKLTIETTVTGDKPKYGY
jgi:hypothetical protein